jgi:phenylalanyl-tRNA synthetase beta chain
MFEVGEVAQVDKDAPHGSRTELHLCALVAHGEVTLSEVHADADFLAFQLGVDAKVLEMEHPSFLPGRSAQIQADGKPVGWLGELHPEVLERWEITMPVAAFELDLGALL